MQTIYKSFNQVVNKSVITKNMTSVECDFEIVVDKTNFKVYEASINDLIQLKNITQDEIEHYINQGKTIYWKHKGYKVIKNNGDFFNRLHINQLERELEK